MMVTLTTLMMMMVMMSSLSVKLAISSDCLLGLGHGLTCSKANLCDAIALEVVVIVPFTSSIQIFEHLIAALECSGGKSYSHCSMLPLWLL